MDDRNKKLEAFFFTNKGGQRSNNEDGIVIGDILISDLSMEIPESYRSNNSDILVCVADGIGGEQKGEVASQLVLSYLQNHISDITDDDAFTKIIYEAKEQLEMYVKKNPEAHNLGCTLAGVIVRPNTSFIFNIGDCRVYRVNGNFFERITHDHSVVQHLFDEGVITEDEMRHHPRKNIVTSSVSGDGIDNSVKIWMTSIPMREKDTFFICSDGIWECFSQDELEMIHSKFQGYDFCERILIAGLARQAADNISAILLTVRKNT